MLSSSRITKAKRGSAISSCALPQARSAAAMSRLMSCVSQVKPSPIVCQETRSPNVCSASRSAECQAPLTNCTTPTRLPRPSMRSAKPNAAVDFPLPGPVCTISRPFSIVLPATSASCTALRLAILARWRSASASLTAPIRTSFDEQWHAGHEQNDSVCLCGHPLIEQALAITETARQRIVAHDTAADLVGDQEHRGGHSAQGHAEPLDFRLDLGVRHHEIGKPKRQT